MKTEYDEYELLELFGNEPIIKSLYEEGNFFYKKIGSDGINITLGLSIRQGECNIGLNFKGRLIFQASLKDVEYLRSEEKNGRLRVHQNGSSQDYLIYFVPSLFIIVEDV
jgi:hypothetical protein